MFSSIESLLQKSLPKASSSQFSTKNSTNNDLIQPIKQSSSNQPFASLNQFDIPSECFKSSDNSNRSLSNSISKKQNSPINFSKPNLNEFLYNSQERSATSTIPHLTPSTTLNSCDSFSEANSFISNQSSPKPITFAISPRLFIEQLQYPLNTSLPLLYDHIALTSMSIFHDFFLILKMSIDKAFHCSAIEIILSCFQY